MSDLPRRIGVLLLLVLAVALPFVLGNFWLQLGLFVMAMMVGAIGLTLLVGVAGQLSLGHAGFAAIGAYVYVWATAQSDGKLAGAGLPSLVGLLLAVAAAALVGFVFSPVASRLRGVYLGLATLGLVFIVRHLLLNLDGWTGGFAGRSVAPFTLGGFSFSNSSPDYLVIAGVQFDGLHRLWYLFLVLTLIAAWLAANLRTSRTGRAWANLRDSETAAAAMGIAVARYKASAFVVSSGYAGLAGALLALAYGRLAPDVFTLDVSIDFLVMIVLGGLGSVAGAMAGALFVTALPLVLTQYSSSLPFLAAPGSGGLDPATAARMLYGLAIIAVLLFVRGGLAGGLRRLRGRTGALAVAGAADGTSPPAPPTDAGHLVGPSPSRSKETAR